MTGTGPLTCDVAIVGGGIAGSLLALVLARRGLSALVVDLREPYPRPLRYERFSAEQLTALGDLGATGLVHAADGQGMPYERVVDALRQAWPETARLTRGEVTGIVPGAVQRLTLHDGSRINSRLCVLATGLSEKLRHNLGLERTVLSQNHSVCVEFNLVRRDGSAFGFDHLVHHGDASGDGVGYASLSRRGDVVQVNLFLYDSPESSRLQRFRRDPLAELLAVMPGLRGKLGHVKVSGHADIRVTDLYDVDASALEGVTLIGDARHTSCPASGTGMNRILNDVRVLAEAAAPDRLHKAAATFHADTGLRALDAAWHKQSLDGRERAVNTSIGWRVNRVAHRLNSVLARPSKVRPRRAFLMAGDRVRVRPAVEILATLDMDGALENLPFMPEMASLIGTGQRVLRRADRTCVEGFGLRGLKDTVFLDQMRCDGAAHDACQRDCLMFWKEAWLVDADAPVPPVDAAERTARQVLRELAVRQDDRFYCQSTQLSTASHYISQTHVREMLHEVKTGGMLPSTFGRIAIRAFVNKARAAVKLPELGLIVGEKGKKSKGDLDLKPGEWVRIRDADAIKTTLNDKARNLGLSFEPEMAMLIGEIRQVDTVVERMIHEETGKMVRLERTVTLKDTYCLGMCAKNCPRSNPLFWREAWLERVEAPEVRMAAE